MVGTIYNIIWYDDYAMYCILGAGERSTNASQNDAVCWWRFFFFSSLLYFYLVFSSLLRHSHTWLWICRRTHVLSVALARRRVGGYVAYMHSIPFVLSWPSVTQRRCVDDHSDDHCKWGIRRIQRARSKKEKKNGSANARKPNCVDKYSLFGIVVVLGLWSKMVPGIYVVGVWFTLFFVDFDVGTGDGPTGERIYICVRNGE